MAIGDEYINSIGNEDTLLGQVARATGQQGAIEKVRSQLGSGRDMAFGSDKDAGFFGTGQRQVNRFNVDPSAAQNARNDYWQQYLQQAAGAAGQRGAPTMQAAQLGQAAMYGGATIDQSQQAQFRQGQQQLVSQLQAAAAGQGPSVAQGQLKQATDRNMAQALSMAAATNPYGGGSGLRQVAAQRAAAGQQAASDSSLLRAQEQQAAQNQLGQVLAGARGQDIGLASEQAGLLQQAGLANQSAQNQFALQQGTFNQQSNMANQSAQLQQTQMNDALTQFYVSQGMSLDEANRKAAMDMQNMQLQGSLGYEGLDNQSYYGAAGNRVNQSQFATNQLKQLLSSAGQGAATGVASGGGGGGTP
jgi:hypothetical protein